MKIVLVEDSEKRIEQFQELHGDDELHIFRTSMEAIDFLSEHFYTTEWDILYLDNDLGYEGPKPNFYEGSGEEVARYLIQTRPRIKYIRIHSWNSPAAKRILSAVTSAGYNAEWIPF